MSTPLASTGYVTKDGRYVEESAVNLSPAEGAALTIDGYSAEIECGRFRTMRLRLLTTAVSTSDVVDVTIEMSSNGSTWYTAETFTQVATTINATWDQHMTFVCDRFVRAKYDVTGSGVSIATTLTGLAV